MSLTFVVFLTVPDAGAEPRSADFGCRVVALHLHRLRRFRIAASGYGRSARMPETLHPEYRLTLTSAAHDDRGDVRAGQPHLDFLHLRDDRALRLAHRLCRHGAADIRRRVSIGRASCRSCSRYARSSWASPPIATRVSSERLGMRLISHSAILVFICVAGVACGRGSARPGRHVDLRGPAGVTMAAFSLSASNFGAMAMEPVGSIAGIGASLARLHLDRRRRRSSPP